MGTDFVMAENRIRGHPPVRFYLECGVAEDLAAALHNRGAGRSATRSIAPLWLLAVGCWMLGSRMTSQAP